MSHPTAALPTLIAIADSALPSAGPSSSPSLARPRPLGEPGRGVWVAPVNAPDAALARLRGHAALVNQDRRRFLAVSRERGTLVLRECGKTLARGPEAVSEGIREAVPMREAAHRFLSLRDEAAPEAVASVWDATMAGGDFSPVATVDGDGALGATEEMVWGGEALFDSPAE